MTATLDVAAVRSAVLTPDLPWRELRYEAACPSTNALAAAEARPWHIVTTDDQTGGKGRLGREWVTAPGKGLAVSVCVPVPPGRTDLVWLPLLVGVAVAQGISSVCGELRPSLKWPNDVLLGPDQGKVCGVLAELLPGQHLVVLGAGINVLQQQAELPVPTATSISAAGCPVSREGLLIAYLRVLGAALADWFRADQADASARVLAAYRPLSSTLGNQVTISLPNGELVRGQAVDLAPGGELVLEVAGQRRTFPAGDVVHAGIR